MEALGGYPTRSSNPKAKKLTVLLSMTVGVGCLFLLQTQLLKPGKPVDFYTFEVKDAKGRTVLLEKYRGKVGPHHRRIKLTFYRARKIGKVDHVLTKFKKKKLCWKVVSILCFIRRWYVSLPPPLSRCLQASLVVNVASHSEQTESNYRALQELHRELGPSHFNVLAFPCGQFGDTETMNSREIEAFAKSTYGVTFPFFSRIKILGSEAEPAFRFLTGQQQPRL